MMIMKYIVIILNDVHMMLLLIITSFTIFSIANIYVTLLKYLRKSCFIFLIY